MYSGTHFSVCAFGLDPNQSESNVQAPGILQRSFKSLKPNSKPKPHTRKCVPQNRYLPEIASPHISFDA
jgi:hypothetical protein